MRRVLLMVPVLLAVVAATFVVTHDWSDDRPVAAVGLTADTVPFPGSTKPLPVPEIMIDDPAWRDELGPSVTPTAPTVPPGVKGCGGQLLGYEGKSTPKPTPRLICEPE